MSQKARWLRRRKRLPDAALEAISDAKAAASLSPAMWGKWCGLMAMAQALGWDGFDVAAQVDEFDLRNPRDPSLRLCCRTDPLGGHRGTCLESVMYGWREAFSPPGC